MTNTLLVDEIRSMSKLRTLEVGQDPASKIIAKLPAMLTTAAKTGNSLVVMILDKEGDVNHLLPIEDHNIEFLAETLGVDMVLKDTAEEVASFLIKEGFSVTIRLNKKEHQLVASW